ncbi:MAG: class I SAM-dependent methyltransferase [Archangium sp.]
MSSLRAAERQVVRAATRAREVLPGLRLLLADEPLTPWLATEAQSGRVEGPPFWAHAWPGGLALAKWVSESPERVHGKRVLDFASGCGVSAIAAKVMGAREVTATEIDSFACAAVEENAALNGVSLEVRGDDVIGCDDGWDVVLVGDVFYEDELSRRVATWLRTLAARGAVVRIGDPGRSFLPMQSLACEVTYAFSPSPAWDSVVDRPARVWSVP